MLETDYHLLSVTHNVSGYNLTTQKLSSAPNGLGFSGGKQSITQHQRVPTILCKRWLGIMPKVLSPALPIQVLLFSTLIYRGCNT
jgi:hypothetical protein